MKITPATSTPARWSQLSPASRSHGASITSSATTRATRWRESSRSSPPRRSFTSAPGSRRMRKRIAGRRFIKDKVKGAHESAMPGFALALTAFLAVIREGAETIVFFQALTVGATETVGAACGDRVGIAVASVGLAITFIVLSRRGASNPVRQVLLCDHDPALRARGGIHRPGNRKLPGIRRGSARPSSSTSRRSRCWGFIRRCRVSPRSFALLAFAAAAMIIPHGSARASEGGSGSFSPASVRRDLSCGGSASRPPSLITRS